MMNDPRAWAHKVFTESRVGPLDNFLLGGTEGEPEALEDDSGEVLSEKLLAHYGLTIGEQGVERLEGDFQTFFLSMIDLLNDSLYYASISLAESALRSGDGGCYRSTHLDDHEDYTNAISDQIRWILDCFQNTRDDDELLDRIFKLLNAEREDLDDCEAFGIHAHGFLYGYADHFTPLSQLMLANTDL